LHHAAGHVDNPDTAATVVQNAWRHHAIMKSARDLKCQAQALGWSTYVVGVGGYSGLTTLSLQWREILKRQSFEELQQRAKMLANDEDPMKRGQIFEFFDPDRIVAFLIAHSEISCQSIFATFPSPHFPRAAATLSQHGIAQFHALCI
jgi:hypothetical protein